MKLIHADCLIAMKEMADKSIATTLRILEWLKQISEDIAKIDHKNFDKLYTLKLMK